MRLVVLTTQTPHHAYFVRRLNEQFPVVLTLVETQSNRAPFPTHHSFEDTRDAFERQTWFDGADVQIDSITGTEKFPSLNDPVSVRRLEAVRPDVVVVFGAGKLSRDVLEICPDHMFNLHGGDPERDRGLDTHLWAVYEDRFDALHTTLHRVNDKLDDGEVVVQRRVPVARGMPLHALRRANTEVCLDLTTDMLQSFRQSGGVPSRPQRARGRYFSFMPAGHKAVCVTKFQRYSSALV